MRHSPLSSRGGSPLIGTNVWFARRLRWAQDLEKEIVLQASVDLLVLTGWLNASGGIENRFYHVCTSSR